MNPKWLSVAAEMLDLASEEFSNHGCCDWEFPADWTLSDKQELVEAMHEDNGSPEEYNPNYLSVPDWWVMCFLASRLQKEAEEE